MSKNKPEVDCTRRCKSRSHGQALTSAITKRSITDEALTSFIKATCANFVKAFDFEVCIKSCLLLLSLSFSSVLSFYLNCYRWVNIKLVKSLSHCWDKPFPMIIISCIINVNKGVSTT